MRDPDLHQRRPGALEARRLSVPVALPVALLVALLVGPPAAAAPATASDRGAQLLQTHCGACHAVTAGGVSPMAEAPPFDTLGGEYPPGHLAEALAEGIVTGHADMPEVRFAPDELEAVLTYLEALALPVPQRRPDG